MFSKVLGVAGRLLIVAGVVILGFVAYQLWGTGLEESRQQDEMLGQYAQSIGADSEAALEEVVAQPVGTPSDEPPPNPEPGEPVGVIEIPRIELARVMVQGTSRADLKKGPGHYIGTPMPGQPGNVGIAGHRTTYGAPFNRIDELQVGDEIVVSTSQGRFTYKVIPAPGSSNQAWYTVKPSQTEVLDDMGDNRLTLTACHPKYSAKQRIIVNAVLQEAPAPASPVPEESTDSATSVAQDFDQGLGSTPAELPVALTFGGIAAGLALAAWLVGHNVKQWWAVWLVATPIIVVLVWNAYVHMDRYLPAI
ncbi:MAG: class E sortase [Microthrixaceae bacterium]